MKSFKQFLEGLRGSTDVQVKLNSFTTYENGYVMQDGCGNHHAKTWEKAVEQVGDFDILSCEFVDTYDRPQFNIVLNEEKNWRTTKLDHISNDIAAKSLFSENFDIREEFYNYACNLSNESSKNLLKSIICFLSEKDIENYCKITELKLKWRHSI